MVRRASWLAGLLLTRLAAEEDVGACLASPRPCDDARRCDDRHNAYAHACLATPIPAWSVAFNRVQCCFRCCMIFWLDEFGLRRNHELWMRANAELHPRDKFTFEHVKRSGLDELPPESVLNVNSRVATLAHYYVEFRGKNNLLAPGSPRYAAATAAAHVRAVEFEKTAAGLRASPRPDIAARADDRKPFRAAVPLETFRAPRVNATLLFTSPGSYLREHVHWAAAHLPAPVTVVGGGDGGIHHDALCGGSPPLCRADGCLDRAVVAAAFVQNVVDARVEQPCPSNVRPLAQGVKHASWASWLATTYANASTRDGRAAPLVCSFMAAHPGRVEKFDALRANGFDACTWDFKPDVGAYLAALRGSKFAAAPRGIGQTCMREWEAVLLGAVPVLERFPAHGDLYGSAPRLEIESWADVTPALLDAAWADLAARDPPPTVERAFFPFWLHELTAGWL